MGAKVLHILLGTCIVSLWSPLSRLGALYWYYENTVVRFLWYCFVFIRFILKVYIYLLCINGKRLTTSQLEFTYVLSSRDHQNTELYQAPSDHCEGYRNSDLIRLLQKSQAIHNCNQSMLSIIPDLNICVFSITIVDIISSSALVRL